MKIVFLIIVFLLSIGGCAVKKVPPTQSYIIDPHTPKIEKSIKKPKFHTIKVTIANIGRLSQTHNIYYRNKNFILQPYAYGKWYDSLGNMIKAKLIEALQQTNIASNVIGSSANIKSEMILEISILDFVQDFSKGEPSTVHISWLATLIQIKDDQVVKSKHFKTTIKSTSENAKGGVVAFNQGTNIIVNEIAKWLLD
ncbi:ABC-type transport auxiliary lipoprotein family protein [Hydrogenimonas thermophila]|uniref:ABC-type uncharacterized transport system, auxiliary component n=1 Tax=Hydrogenimonas thermophila TaxID=223786 RepID=A0A1I5NYT2_9BACT|nr:ABC-type transport auxiliary lipoprotein family protein [Hydrogenimonas thermophila]SFP26411.1 ABC-type uncharacterized transport system, auxiliary component [Hydrogenimonas thermophila]